MSYFLFTLQLQSNNSIFKLRNLLFEICAELRPIQETLFLARGGACRNVLRRMCWNGCREGRQCEIDGAVFCLTILLVAISWKVGQHWILGLQVGPFLTPFRPKIREFVNFLLRQLSFPSPIILMILYEIYKMFDSTYLVAFTARLNKRVL